MFLNKTCLYSQLYGTLIETNVGEAFGNCPFSEALASYKKIGPLIKKTYDFFMILSGIIYVNIISCLKNIS